MNLVARQNFAHKPNGAPNTFIGGVSATLSTAALLATKLGISVGAISNFSIAGADIQCRITGSYAIPISAFGVSSPCTYYTDSDKLVNYIYDGAFYLTSVAGECNFENAITVELDALRATNFTKFLLKNATTIGNNCFYASNKADVFYIPSCTTLGSSTGNNAVFDNIKSGAVIYANPALATNNAGAPDGDLTNAITNYGATVRYVTSFVAPSNITDLAAGSVYNTAVQLTFTAPSSTNTIDYYECYANGVLKNKIKTSGQYLIGLTASTSYTITVVAVDIFYNKSIVSNTVTQSTNTTSAVPLTGLVSYYNRESNVNDSYGSNNGTDTDVLYEIGKVGNAAKYNGSTSRSSIGNPASLQLSTVSISCWVKSSGAGSGDRGLVFKRLAYNIFFYNNKLATYSYGSPVGYKDTGVDICDGTWKHVVLTQQSGVTNGTKLYIDGTLSLTTTVSHIAQTDNLEIGSIFSSGNANFIIDEMAIYNVLLTQTDVDLLYNSGSGGTL